jgi:deazaflavin-dependent oxidoreductase (nitroreductase family)
MLLRLPAFLYQCGLGGLLGSRFLLLTHVGRRSGVAYQTVLEVVGRDPDGSLTVLSGFGRDADWYRNLCHQPVVEITVGSTTRVAWARTLAVSEAAETIDRYHRDHPLLRPVINQVLTALVGWGYDGSPQSQLHLAEQLPVVKFEARRT